MIHAAVVAVILGLGATAPSGPLAASDTWSREHASHLLRRAGFGGTPEQIAFLTGLGRKKAVAYLLDYESLPGALPRLDLARPPPPIRVSHPDADRKEIQKIRGQRRRADRVQLQKVTNWWLEAMVSSPRPLQEKMVLFWHGHLTSGYREVRSSRALYVQNQLFRRRATGKFRDLLIEITEDPAMILYLNTQQNVKRKPNENYARELMELFTMGVGSYTEHDIREAARAFTGILTDPQTCEVFHTSGRHDFGEKTFLGETGSFDPADIIDIILKQPATAEFMARKLWTFFAYEDPDDSIIEALGAVFRESDHDVKTVLGAMFLSDAFYGDRARFTHVKSPVELLVGTLRALEIPVVDATTLCRQLRTMGQDLFQPPNVKGWDGGLTWINTSTLFDRYNALRHVIFGDDNPQFRRQRRKQREQLLRTLGAEAPVLTDMDAARMLEPQSAYDPTPVLKDMTTPTAEAIVDHYIDRLLQRRIAPERRQSLIDALKQQINTRKINSPSNARGIRTLLHLIVSMPEYQLS